jgi:RNA polymerase subunit RPABC4/transcription elongation factor Spt4
VKPSDQEHTAAVVVASYLWITEAEMARIRLAEEGIEATIRDGGVTGINPLLANAVGGIKLVVSREEAAEAERILADHEKRMRRERARRCPRCESTDVTEQRLGFAGMVLSILTLGLYYVAVYRPYRCNDCQNRWW